MGREGRRFQQDTGKIYAWMLVGCQISFGEAGCGMNQRLAEEQRASQ